jgi:tRNA(fMet)-specific endonuclease VapC
MSSILGGVRSPKHPDAPIGSMDMLIAAHALALNSSLVTNNEKEFARVPGLRTENWV